MIENLQTDSIIDFYLQVGIKDIRNYLLGAINCFVRQKKSDWLRAKDIIINDWNGTPLQIIYDFFETNGLSEEEARKQARICLGKILRKVIFDDQEPLKQEKLKIILGNIDYNLNNNT